LAASGVAQLELRGHEVISVFDLDSAYRAMDECGPSIHMIIADQLLPDGYGKDFVIEMKERFPKCLFAIVSGCLEPDDMKKLSSQGIPYFHKPLLYAKVFEELRR